MNIVTTDQENHKNILNLDIEGLLQSSTAAAKHHHETVDDIAAVLKQATAASAANTSVGLNATGVRSHSSVRVSTVLDRNQINHARKYMNLGFVIALFLQLSATTRDMEQKIKTENERYSEILLDLALLKDEENKQVAKG